MAHIRNNPAGRSAVVHPPHNWPSNVRFENFKNSFERLSCPQIQRYVSKLSTLEPGIAPALAALCADQHQLFSAYSALLSAHTRQAKIVDSATENEKPHALLLLQEIVVIRILFFQTHKIYNVHKKTFARDILDLAERPNRKEVDIINTGSFLWAARSLLNTITDDRKNLPFRLNLVAALTYAQANEIRHSTYDSKADRLWSLIKEKANTERDESLRDLMLHILDIHALNQKRRLSTLSVGEIFMQKIKNFVAGPSDLSTAIVSPKQKAE